MRPVQFDPFGEPVAEAVGNDGTSTASRFVLRAGVGLFWGMVAAIVVARAAYFDPDFAERFGAVASLVGHVKAITGA